MRIYGLVLRVVGLILLSSPPGLNSSPGTVHPSAEDLVRMAQLVHQYVNQERRSLGIPALDWNEPVAAEARRHAGNIAEKRFFTHEDPVRGNIDLRLRQSGVDWHQCAENLYEADFGNPPKDAVRAWLHSSGHRKNMMDSTFSDAGVGVAVRSDGWIVVVQEYIQK